MIVDEIDEIFWSLRESLPGHDELTTDILKLGLAYKKLSPLYALNLSPKQGVFSKGTKNSQFDTIILGRRPNWS